MDGPGGGRDGGQGAEYIVEEAEESEEISHDNDG